jgi:hypothetical protein
VGARKIVSEMILKGRQMMGRVRLDLSGVLDPSGKFANAHRGHADALKTLDPDVLPDDAVQLGYIWITQEDDAVAIELRPDRLPLAKRWLSRNGNPNMKFEFKIEQPNGRFTMQTLSFDQLV